MQQRKKSKTTSRKQLWVMLKERQYLNQAKKFLIRYNQPVGIATSSDYKGQIVYGIQSIEIAPINQGEIFTFSPVTEIQSPPEKEIIFSAMNISPEIMQKFFGGGIIAGGKIWRPKTDL